LPAERVESGVAVAAEEFVAVAVGPTTDLLGRLRGRLLLVLDRDRGGRAFAKPGLPAASDADCESATISP
jgi:hypothetical protein